MLGSVHCCLRHCCIVNYIINILLYYYPIIIQSATSYATVVSYSTLLFSNAIICGSHVHSRIHTCLLSWLTLQPQSYCIPTTTSTTLEAACISTVYASCTDSACCTGLVCAPDQANGNAPHCIVPDPAEGQCYGTGAQCTSNTQCCSSDCASDSSNTCNSPEPANGGEVMEQMESSSTAAPATTADATLTVGSTTSPGNRTGCYDAASDYQCSRVVEKGYCEIPTFRSQCKCGLRRRLKCSLFVDRMAQRKH